MAVRPSSKLEYNPPIRALKSEPTMSVAVSPECSSKNFSNTIKVNGKRALQAAFELFDVDGNGTISMSELEQLALCLGKRLSRMELVKFCQRNGVAIKAKGDTMGGIVRRKSKQNMFMRDTILFDSKESLLNEKDGFSLPQFYTLVRLLKDAEASSLHEALRPRISILPLFDHDQTWRVTWDIALIGLLLYVCLMTPYRIGLFVEATGVVQVFEIMVDMAFVVDILFQFRTSYIDDEGNRVQQPMMIANRYFRGYFFIDFVSCMPWDQLVPSDSEAAESSKLFKTLRLMKLAKLGRVARLKKFFETFKEYFDIDRETINIFAALVVLCFATHMIACAWAFSGRYGSTTDDFCMRSWQGSQGFCDLNKNVGEYTTSLYWAITCLTTVGFGDISPVNDLEKAIASAAMVIGGSYYGYLIAVLTAFIVAEDSHTHMVNNSMSELNSYMKRFNYPRALRRKLNAYFHHFYDNISHFDDMQMLRQLPYKLHNQTAKFLVDKIFRDYAVFSRLEDQTITMFLQVLEPWSTKKGEMVAEIGHPAESLFLLSKGCVNITDASGKTVAEFHSGQSFMEYGILHLKNTAPTLHMYNAITFVPSEIYMIDAVDLEKAVTSPKDMEQLLSNISALQQFRKIAGFSLLEPPKVVNIVPSDKQMTQKRAYCAVSIQKAVRGHQTRVRVRKKYRRGLMHKPKQIFGSAASSDNEVLEVMWQLQAALKGIEGAVLSLDYRMIALERKVCPVPAPTPKRSSSYQGRLGPLCLGAPSPLIISSEEALVVEDIG